jgi:hypothetical protein
MQQGLVIALQRRGRFRGEDLDFRLWSRITLFKTFPRFATFARSGQACSSIWQFPYILG